MLVDFVVSSNFTKIGEQMKKKVSIVILFILALALVACTGKPKSNGSNQVPNLPDDIEMEPPSGPSIDLTNADVFETGYYCMRYDTFDGAYLYISSTNVSDLSVEWKVYILDNEISEEEAEKLVDTQEPIAINDGSTHICEGQWIYVFCNINSKTASEPTDSSFNMYSMRDYI